MTFDEFVAKYAETLHAATAADQRHGQYAFNLLHDVRPDIANNYVRTFYGIDPFYRDDCLPRFFEEVALRWVSGVQCGYDHEQHPPRAGPHPHP